MNKERVYNYFGGKPELFVDVLRDQLATAAIEVPEGATEDDIAEYAGRLYDYHRQHPGLARLLQWEALTFDAEVPEEQSRREFYERNTSALAHGQFGGGARLNLGAGPVALPAAVDRGVLGRPAAGSPDDHRCHHRRRI